MPGRVGEVRVAADEPRILFPPSERGPSAPVPSNMYENWAGVDIMSHSDGRWRRQSLVYFGNSQDSSANVTGGAFRGARGYVPGPLLSNIWYRRTTRMYSEFGSLF